MFAVWDEFPQIKAGDLYFSLKEAQSGKLTQEYLLGLAEATDKELEGVTDEKGTISCGEDRKHHSTFLILDYRAEDFTEAEEDMSMTITYYARDAVGNETKKMVTVHLADTFPRKCESGNVRFISQEHKGVYAARNAALEIAAGEYLFFLDSDDAIHPCLLETMYSVLHKTNAAMAAVHFQLPVSFLIVATAAIHGT